MRITPNILMIGSGRLGFGLSDPLDCNVYLIRCGDAWAMIDAGAGRDVDALLQIAQADGIDPATIRHLLLTHAHADHAGGCAELRRRLGLEIWASREVAGWVSQGDEAAISLNQARVADIYPADYHFTPCPVDHILEAGVPFVLGGREIVPLATPGHADGHLSYRMQDGSRASLFVGDLLLCGGQVLLQFTHDCSLQKLGASLLSLGALNIDALYPGHLHFCLSGGQAHIEAAVARLHKLLIPPSLA